MINLHVQDFHFLWCVFPVRFHFINHSYVAALQPHPCRNIGGFRLFPVRSPLLRESLLFSFPPGNEMFQFPGFASSCLDTTLLWWVAPFGHLRINSYLPIPAAFRSLSRPSSPQRAKASSVRPSLLSSRLCFKPLINYYCKLIIQLSSRISPSYALLLKNYSVCFFPACQRTLPL